MKVLSRIFPPRAAVFCILAAQAAPYHPAQCSIVRQSRGLYVIRIGFAAPSPAGL